MTARSKEKEQPDTTTVNKYTVSDKASEGQLTDKLTVHFLDVGQGDCVLITCGEHAMLIDAGDNSMGTTVELYLRKQNIKKLDYVIGTHPDADHIGGMDVIIYKFDCDTIILPDFEKNTATYRDVIDTINNKNYKITRSAAGKTYSLGQSEFTVISPVSDNYGDNANNYSVGIRLTYGDTSFLLAGDAEEEAEEDMLDSGQELKADVFKASHHGSRTSNTEEFLEAVNPKYAVISCGENNKYGHPHAQTLNTLRAMGIKVFRTDEQGAVIIKSDGKELTFNCSPSESWKAGN
ncbi:MAG: MBL fold metallo-hydrolase [Lachnospiraceae bacterium]